MATLMLVIVDLYADTHRIESIPVSDAADVRAAIDSHAGYVVEGPTFTLDDDDNVTYHATIVI